MNECEDFSSFLAVSILFGAIASCWFWSSREGWSPFRQRSVSKECEENDVEYRFKPLVYTEGAAVPPDVTHIDVHRSVEVLEPGVFADLRRLEEVVLREGLRKIGAKAFTECPSLKQINCPSTLLEIGKYAFLGCHSMAEVRFTKGLESIGRYAFLGCNSLERVNFPSTVTWIGTSAFFGCTSLTEVTVTGGILSIEAGAFGDCHVDLVRIAVPSRAFVAEAGDPRKFNIHLVTNRNIGHSVVEGEGVTIIAPRCLMSVSPSAMVEVGNIINTIMNRSERWEENLAIDAVINCMKNFERMRVRKRVRKLERVRELITYYAMVEVSSILELVLWKEKMANVHGAGKINFLDVSTRNMCRVRCGADDIIPTVLSFL